MLKCVVAVSLTATLISPCQADECDSILEQGVRNLFATKTTSTFQSDVQSAFCHSSGSVASSGSSGGASVGFPLYGVPLQFGGNYSSSDYKQMQDQNCGSNSAHFASSGYQQLLSAVADPTIVSAWKECRDNGGFYINAEANGNQIVLTFRFKPAGPVTSAKVTDAPTIKGAICPKPVLKLGTRITNVTKSEVCTRQDKGPVTIVVNTDYNSRTFLIPAIRVQPRDPSTTPIDAAFKVLPLEVAPICDHGPSPLPAHVPTAANGLYNLALLLEARATASSIVPLWPGRHQISFLNDGWYNNCRSWLANIMPAWAQVDLGKDYEISMVAFGSEYQAFYRDRQPTDFNISVSQSADPNNWVTVYAAKNHPVSDRQEFPFPVITARYVRVAIDRSENGTPRIDELEIWGKWHP